MEKKYGYNEKISGGKSFTRWLACGGLDYNEKQVGRRTLYNFIVQINLKVVF